MKKFSFNRKNAIVAIYTLAIIIIFSLTIYPNTNSKFLKDKQNVIAYNSTLPNNYKGQFTLAFGDYERNLSNVNEIHLRVGFVKDSNSTNEYYTLDIANGANSCFINHDVEMKNVTIDGENKIRFNENATNGEFDIYCDVTEGVDINVSGYIYEWESDDDHYIYRVGAYYKEYDKYRVLFSDKDKIIITSSTPYQDLIDIIQNYLDNGYGKEFTSKGMDINKVKNYLSHNGISSDADKDKFIKAGETFTVVNGITGTCDTNECTYYINDNFVGLVKTDYWYQPPQMPWPPVTKNIYFSTTNVESIANSNLIKNGLKYATATYAYPNDKLGDEFYKDLITLYIQNYLADNNQLYTLTNLGNIPGIMYNPKGSDDKWPYIYYDSRTVYYAYNYKNRGSGNIKVLQDAIEVDMADIFNEAIKDLYSSEMQNYLTITASNYTTELSQSILCKGSNCTSYSETIYDSTSGEYLVINVEHDSDNKVNNIKIDKYTDFAGLTNSNITSEKLNNALKNNEDINEFYYKYDTDEYIAVSATPVDLNPTIKRITIKTDTELSEILSSSTYDSELIKSIKDNFTTINANSTCQSNEKCSKYNEVHYSNGKYLLVNVSHNIDEEYNIVTIYQTEVSTPDVNCDNIFTNLELITIYMPKDQTTYAPSDNHIIPYLKNKFGFEVLTSSSEVVGNYYKYVLYKLD